MHWIDEGLVLSAKKHGENSVIVQALTREHGRHAGLVRGGTSKRLRGVLQPGNEVGLRWNGRLSEHLGHYTIEAKSSKGAMLFDQPLNLSAISSALSLLEKTLPERESCLALYTATLVLLDNLKEDLDQWGPLFVKWELGLLSELGYGLDLEKCTVTGRQEDLVYVSPKSGSAVCQEAGFPYHDKLLKLPRFLRQTAYDADINDLELQILEGLSLTGYFIQKRLLPNYSAESLPARERFLNAVTRQTELRLEK